MLIHRCCAIFICFILAGCGLPRGAGFQSEILGPSGGTPTQDGQEDTRDFAVYEVNRATLPVLQAWPATGRSNLPWITAQSQPASLIIAAGDSVQLTIWDAEENSLLAGAGQRVTPLQTSKVSAGGTIFVPYIGKLRIAGMSPATARERIEEELIRTIPSAQVQLVVDPGRSNSANMSAGVSAIGLYQLPDRNFTILELFSLAAGPSADINIPLVRLVRDGKTYGVPYARLLEEPRLNATVRGGDRIYVVEDERQFMTLGATGSQALFNFPKAEISALEAIALIGGVNAGTANPEAILVMRNYKNSAVSDGISGPPKERVVFTIDLTSADGLFSAGQFMLENNDLIYGTESPLGAALTLIGFRNSVSSIIN